MSMTQQILISLSIAFFIFALANLITFIIAIEHIKLWLN